jgi:hypothetical protein
VILSSVRTEQPGFLKSQPRMNVALTRCRKGMVVVTDKCFLQSAGRGMLLGQLCRTWSLRRDACWVDWRAMLNNSAALPGLPLPLPPLAPSRLPASSTSQQQPALTRIGEQSRPVPIQSFSWRTTMLPRDPPSKPLTQTWSQTRTTQQTSLFTLAAAGRTSETKSWRHRTTVTAADPVASDRNSWRRGSSSSIPTATTAVPRELDDAFPPLRESATALYQPPRHRSSKGW